MLVLIYFFWTILNSSGIDIDTFFRDIESIKSSRFSVPEQDVPTGLYLQDYDQYLTNDQKTVLYNFCQLFGEIKYEPATSLTNGSTGWRWASPI